MQAKHGPRLEDQHNLMETLDRIFCGLADLVSQDQKSLGEASLCVVRYIPVGAE
jgi:hypothetical protein